MIAWVQKTGGEGCVVVGRVETARTFWQRAAGLLGRRGLSTGTVLWIRRAPSIHTIGMRFPIDAVFLDRTHRIVKVVWNVSPGRFVFGGLGADSVLEAEAGWLDRNRIAAGSSIAFAVEDPQDQPPDGSMVKTVPAR